MTTANQSTWVLDPGHSEILFKVKHLMITNVKGEFRKFSGGAVATGAGFSDASVHVTIEAASIFTNSEERDNHLRSADFFDAETYPELTFQSTAFSSEGDDRYLLTGLLTIRGISREVTLDVELGGITKDPWGNEKAGFSLSGKISRKEWGLNWNAALETGGVLVSDEVKISADVQLVRQA